VNATSSVSFTCSTLTLLDWSQEGCLFCNKTPAVTDN